jgi:DNA-binding PadR family transcriptional regulator
MNSTLQRSIDHEWFSLSDPEPVRGGRAKKYVALTPLGKAALKETQAAFHRMTLGVNLQRLG